MFSYAVTCLIWGDDPNNIFSVLFSKKTNIVDIKLKILKRLNLSNDMIEKIKYYKVDEELYPEDKRFNVLKNKDSQNLISPEELFNITEINDVSSLIVNFTDIEHSFNTEDSIGAIIVIDKTLNIKNISSIHTVVESKSNKDKISNDSDFEHYKDLDLEFYHVDDDDENYNGDYEDDNSEYDDKQIYRKGNPRNRRDKNKKQIQKEEKEKIKNRMNSCRKCLYNSIKENNCEMHSCNKRTFSPTNIPTPTEDIINLEKDSLTLINNIENINQYKYSPDSLPNINTSPTFISVVSPNKVETLSMKHSTPGSLKSNIFQNKNIKSNIYANININTNTITSADEISNTNININAKNDNKINKITTDITSSNNNSPSLNSINMINISKDLLIKEEPIEQIITEDTENMMRTKNITVQCASNENINQNPENKNYNNMMEPVLCTNSSPIQESIILENEGIFTPKAISSSNYPSSSISNHTDNTNNTSNTNQSNTINNITKSPSNRNSMNYNKDNLPKTTYIQQPYSRIYYPESDIEVMEFHKHLKPSAPSENQVNNYNPTIDNNNSSLNIVSNYNQYNHSTTELSPINTSSSIKSNSLNRPASNSPASQPARPPSISKSIIFGVDQFPSPPQPDEELDITNVQSSQSTQSDNKRGTVVHQYYKSEMSDLPPSYENIDQQPSAPSLSALNSNNTLTTLLDDHNISMETPDRSFHINNTNLNNDSIESSEKYSDCCSCGCYPCRYLDSCIAKKFNISTKWVGIIKSICIFLLLIISGLIVFYIIHLTQHHYNEQKLDYSIYTITRVSTSVSGTRTVTKTLIHRPVTIEEIGGPSQPTPRSITSNTNEVDDFIIESDGKNADEGLIQWTIKELTDPYLVASYFKPGTESRDDNLTSATFQFRINRIIEINDTIGIDKSENHFDIESAKEDVNFAFFTNSDSKTDSDIFRFSEYFTDENKKLNVTLNYLFTSQSVDIKKPKFAKLNPQAARCFLEIENWNYKYENSKLIIQSSITSSDLVWSVKEENVINLNNSEGKVILIDDVQTQKTNNVRNASLSLYEDVVEFEEDNGVVDVNFLISDVKNSNYLLADFEVLLRSNILDIMIKEEYSQSVNSVVSSSSSLIFSFNNLNFIKKLFNLTIFNNCYFSLKSLLNLRHMKILSIFIAFFIHLIIIYI